MKQMFRRFTVSLLAAVFLLTAGLPASLTAAAAGESTFRRRVLEAWNSRRESVSMFGISMTVDDCIREYYDMLYTAADRFYVSSSFGYSANGSTVYGFWIRYTYETDQIPAMQEEFDSKVEEIVSGVQPGWSEAETVLYFHDWLATHCSYDLTYTRNDAYAAMVGGSAVCQGYALAMCVLCRAAGISCYPVTSDTLRHMWNVVKVDGQWYQCDITFDDVSPDMLGHSRHEYVLVSDDYMRADGEHNADDWNFFAEGQEIACTSKSYEKAFWVGALDAVTPMPDGSWIYAMTNSPDAVHTQNDVYVRVLRTDQSGQSGQIAKLRETWYTETGNIYTYCYISAEVWNGRIYYHTRTDICSMAMDGSDIRTEYTLTADQQKQGSIYGIMIDSSGLLTYQIMAQPMFTDEEMTMQAVYETLQLTAPAEITTETEPTTTETEPTTTETEPTTTETGPTATETDPTTTETEPTTTETEPTTTETEPTTTDTEPTATETEPTAAETALTTTKSDLTTAASDEQPALYGDVDANGKIQVADAVMLARFNAEDDGISLTAQGRRNADCNRDGIINAEDGAWLLEYLAGIRS